MKPTLQLKLSQHLALTPQLQQAIRLLQLSTVELNQEIDQCLQDNPLLELAEPYSFERSLPAESASSHETASHTDEATDSAADHPETDNYASMLDAAQDDNWGNDYASSKPRDANDEDDRDYNEIQAAQITLREHLIAQLGLMPLADHERELARFLIDALNEDGYLAQDLEDLVDLLLNDQQNPTAAMDDETIDRDSLLTELQISLRRLQSLDPPGIGARSPQECLQLQLDQLPVSSCRTHALLLVQQHLETLAHRDFAKLRRALSCSEEELRAAQQLIRSLNPRPGAAYASLETRYITPDVVVRKQRGRWQVRLNQDAMPRLRINRIYADILKTQPASNASLNGQLQEARWLIKNVKQRFDTILRVAEAIVERQQAFFEHGDVAMRPLILREIAETLELHESTISRVTSSKYMATPRGIFEFKYFFGSHVATDIGGAASATAIRALIRQFIAAENPRKPLSDAKLADMLAEQGLVVARRTVAKYREAINIPPANLRKTL